MKQEKIDELYEYDWYNRLLKPCPFCGSDAALVDDELVTQCKEIRYTVCCTNNNCYTISTRSYFFSRDEAVIAWNKRYVND